MTWKVIPGGAAGLQDPESPQLPWGPVAQPSDAATPPEPKPVRVLVVDDEASICKALTMALSRAGYEAIAAQTGESALDICRNDHVDVMLVDLRIPVMRGDVIFEFACGHQPQLRYQTVFMTGDITDDAEHLISQCRCEYLQKPFDLRDMLRAVAALAPRAQDETGQAG